MATPALRGMQAFEAIGRCGTVSAAARDLGVTPGAVSQQVRNVEKCLGLTLLERKGRRVELTSWGRLYYQEISKGFWHLAQAATVLAHAQNQSGIVLSGLTSVVNKWISRKIFDWQAIYPNANIRLLGKDEEPRIGYEGVDFRVTYGNRVMLHEHYTELFRDWMVPVCSPALITKQELQEPADMLHFPLLNVEWEKHFIPSPQWRDFARKINSAEGRNLSSLSFTLSSSAIDAAVSGRGFVLAQISMIFDELASGSLVIPFDIRLELPESYFLAWDRAALEKPFGSVFHKWLIQVSRRQAIQSAPASSIEPKIPA